MTGKKKSAQASLEAMYRVFTVPEAPESTLSRIDQDISRNLAGFLQEHIVAIERWACLKPDTLYEGSSGLS